MVGLANLGRYVPLLVLLMVLAVMQQPVQPFLVALQPFTIYTLKSLDRLHNVQRTVVQKKFNKGSLRITQSDLNTIETPSFLPGTGVAMDLSSIGWGILSVTGPDRYRFLQGMSTADIAAAKIGDVVWGCFLNSKGKVFDYNLMLVDNEDIKIICEAHATVRLINYLDKFIFPMDQVRLKDASSDWNIVSYLRRANHNSASDSIKSKYKYTNQNHTYSIPMNIFNRPYSTHSVTNEVEREIAGGCIEIRSLSHPQTHGMKEVHCETLCLKDEICSIFYDYIRILIGKPKVGQEIEWLEKDLKYTAFELGIADFTIAVDKGCYTGQEIVSKAIKSLNTQAFPSACRRRLVTLSHTWTGNSHIEEGVLKYDDEEVGTVTSMMEIKNLHKLEEYMSSAKSCDEIVQNLLSLIKKTEAGSKLSLVLIASKILQDSVDSHEHLKAQILPSSYGNFDFPLLKSKLLSKEDDHKIKSIHQEIDAPKSSKDAEEERKRQKLEMMAQKIAALKKRGDK